MNKDIKNKSLMNETILIYGLFQSASVYFEFQRQSSVFF